MKVLISQILGIVVSVICLISPQLKKKWQMTAMTLLANFLSGLSFLLLGEVSACGVNIVAILHSVITIHHTNRGKKPSKLEVAFFALLYILGGIFPFLMMGTLASFTWLDTMPIFAALLFCGYMVQRNEQKMRMFSLANCTVFAIYDIIIQSTQVFAQIIGMISVITALIRYRKGKGLRIQAKKQ